MAKVLITGATSFIGVHLVDSFISGGHEVIAVVRPKSPNLEKLRRFPLSQIIELDLLDYELLPKFVIGAVDIVIHLAWNGTRGQSRNDRTLQSINYECSRRLLSVLPRLGCHVFMDAGSQAEYGRVDGLSTEEGIFRPNTEYGIFKRRFFEESSKWCSKQGLRYIHPMFFSLYGAGDEPNALVHSTLRKMIQNNPCEFTKAIQSWNYLYIDDACNIIVRLIFSTAFSGAINLASLDTRLLRDYIYEMKQVCRSNSDLRFGAIPYPSTGMVSIEPSIGLLMNTLSTPFFTPFKNGLGQILKTDFAKDVDG